MPNDKKELKKPDNTDSIANYKLNSEAFQKRVDAFRSMPAPAVLDAELSVARACLEQCINEADLRTAAIWAATINKLSRSHMAAGVMANELLSKRVIAALAEDFLRVISEEFHGLDGFEDRFQRAAERISDAIEMAENGPSDVPGG